MIAKSYGTAVLALLAGCGAAKNPLEHKNSEAQSTASSAPAAADATATGTSTADAFDCLQEKSGAELVTSITQDLFRRGPSQDELQMAQSPTFTAASFVDWAFQQPDYDTGVAYFVSNLLRLEENLVVDPTVKDPDAIALVADLKQEPVVLIQQMKNQPWPQVFTTQDVFCTSRTAALYNFPVDPTIQGFVGCKLPPERAGILGLVSVLRAFPSSFYATNSNRHRVALAIYLAQGLQLAAKTNGPTGSGRPTPLPACVPEVDTRVGTGGLVFGTAAVPKVGPVCAGCHVRYLAPMEPAFLRFDTDGSTMDLPDVDKLNDNELTGISKDTLKNILQYGNESCWSPDDPSAPPEVYTGLPGLARIISGSNQLGQALAVQIQQNLVNLPPDQTTSDAIVASYQAGGSTLQAALRGFFLSEPYQCAQRKGD